jgi:hypothetical protein
VAWLEFGSQFARNSYGSVLDVAFESADWQVIFVNRTKDLVVERPASPTAGVECATANELRQAH